MIKKSKRLHDPIFIGNEIKYLKNCIQSGFVSSVGNYVNKLEKKLCQVTGSKYSVATSSGTAALHLALHYLNIGRGDEVLLPSFTYVATGNSIKYCNATPNFLDIEMNNLGICPIKLQNYLKKIAIKRGNSSMTAFLICSVSLATFNPNFIRILMVSSFTSSLSLKFSLMVFSSNSFSVSFSSRVFAKSSRSFSISLTAFETRGFPYPFVVFMNSLLLYLLIPIGLALYNIIKGNIEKPYFQIFFGTKMIISQARKSFVWPMQQIIGNKVVMVEK